MLNGSIVSRALNTERVDWIDSARGLGIILVVFGHVERGLVSAGIAEGSLWQRFDNVIYTFHMPLFMLLAGMNVPKSLSKGRQSFIKTKVFSVAYPYFVWSIVHGSLMVAASHLTNSDTGLQDLFRIAWKPISPFWFLYALFSFMTAIWILGTSPRFLLPLAVAGLIFAQFDNSESLLHEMGYNFIFFIVGVFYSDFFFKLILPKSYVIYASLVWLISYQLVPVGAQVAYLKPLSLGAAFAGICVIMAISQNLPRFLNSHMKYLGSLSLIIYVSHVLFSSGSRIFFVKIFHIENSVKLFGICSILGIYLPIGLYLMLKRLNLLFYFGLAKRPPVKS